MIPENINQFAAEYLKTTDFKISPITAAGSVRNYFRVATAKKSYILTQSDNIKENKAFLSFANALSAKNLPVPEVFAVADDFSLYIQEDVGEKSLFDLIPEEGVQAGNQALIALYQQALSDLLRFQTVGVEAVDFADAYPRQAFDKRAINWDLNYFKYYFLKPLVEDFDEDILQDGFDVLSEEILQEDANFLMYRDFQSRNIQIKAGTLYYIDFQGARKGPLAYDVVSLLYQARAKISPDVREELLAYYIRELEQRTEISKQSFVKQYQYVALVRMLQVLGAYGFRGNIQNRPHFLKSIVPAIKNLEDLLGDFHDDRLQGMINILRDMIAQYHARQRKRKARKLKVSVYSFSFLKAGLPMDESGHGGGYVFDCRGLPNPGRYQDYKSLTGLDDRVKDFLDQKPEVSYFVKNAIHLTKPGIDKYIERGFEHLMINFGCTGGQHRSVYCAEAYARELNKMYDMEVVVKHHQMEIGY